MAKKMKESGLFWIKKIPDNWVIKKVKYVSKFKAGVGHEGEWDFEGEYIIVNSRFVSTNGHTKKYTDVAHALLNIGDICIVLSDLPNGRALSRCYYIERSNKYTLNQRVGAFYDYSMNGKYFYYIMDRNYGLLKYDDGLNQTNLQYNNVLNCPIIVPPIQEQQKIADYLDKKCTEIEDLKTDIQSQIDILEDYKKSVITETVTKGLNPNVEKKDSGIEWVGLIPKHWKTIRGKYILKLLSKSVKEDDGVITCFRDGEVTLRSNRREDGFTMSDKEIGYQGIDVGDLVVHGMDGFAGAIGISDSRGKASPVLNVLDTIQNKKYIMYYLRSMAYSDVFTAIATGIRVRSCDLRWNKLAELFYPIPSKKEQAEIVAYIDKKILDTNNLIESKKEQLDILEQYKKSLIYEYVTGKKEVSNSNGERL